MSENQQFELKLAVKHHPSLKTEQLIQFLGNQANQFLTNDLPHSLTQDHFITIFQSLLEQPDGDHQNDYNQFVGLMLLYSSSSLQSFQFVKRAIPNQQSFTDLFMIIVEMDNTDKKTNAIGDEGQKMCKKHGYQFVKLTLYNSQDLVTNLHRNLYELIQNYYYPNEEQRPSKKQYESQYQLQYNDSEPQIQNNINISSEKPTQSPKKRKKIVATKQEKRSLQKLLDKASELRDSRNDYISQQQKQIDEAIENVEEVLFNLDQHINSKVKSNWYTSLKHTLFSPLEKNSTSFAKIKLTQQFIDDSDQEDNIPGLFIQSGPRKKKTNQSRTIKNKTIKNQPAKPSKDAIINKFINSTKKKEHIMKLILAVADSVIVELDVYEDTNFDDLALAALRKVGINETEHNFYLMKQILTERVEDYVKQLTKAVRYTQKIRIEERSFLNKKKPASIQNSSQRKANSNYYTYR